ncbi:MAG: hypothetical protein MK233_03750, partial [Candidatus Poseidoniales archaeon]|nr:hypothetical protein [Candidatus Poseidoniales archaeon]
AAGLVALKRAAVAFWTLDGVLYLLIFCHFLITITTLHSSEQEKGIRGLQRALFKRSLIFNWGCVIILEGNNEELLSDLILTFYDASNRVS